MTRAPVMRGDAQKTHGARPLSPALPARRPAGCGSGPRLSNPRRRRCAVSGLYHERAIARARAAERDPALPLN